MRRSIIAVLSLLCFCSAASAQVSVPYVFGAGTPARAAEINANFSALVTGINSLYSRVSKLEGQITAADLVGSYTLNQFQTELGGGASARVAVYTGGGTITLASDSTGTISGNTEKGHQLNLPGLSLTGLNRPQAADAFSWSYGSGTATIFGMNFSAVAGGRLLIGTSANVADGTNVILLLTRNN
jgi:hypothetical protein